MSSVDASATATTVLLGGSTAAEIVAHAESCDAEQPVLVVRCAKPPNVPAT